MPLIKPSPGSLAAKWREVDVQLVATRGDQVLHAPLAHRARLLEGSKGWSADLGREFAGACALRARDYAIRALSAAGMGEHAERLAQGSGPGQIKEGSSALFEELKPKAAEAAEEASRMDAEMAQAHREADSETVRNEPLDEGTAAAVGEAVEASIHAAEAENRAALFSALTWSTAAAAEGSAAADQAMRDDDGRVPTHAAAAAVMAACAADSATVATYYAERLAKGALTPVGPRPNELGDSALGGELEWQAQCLAERLERTPS